MAFMRDANNLNWAFTATYHGSASTGVVNEATDLNHGEVAVLNENNTILSGALSAGDQFKIAQRIGATTAEAELLVSPLFTFQSGAASNYVPASQQVTTIGSVQASIGEGTAAFLLPDATSNALAVAEIGNSFYILIEKQDNDEANRSGYQPAITAQVKLKHPSAYTLDTIANVNLQFAEQLREAIRVNDQLEACNSAGAPRYVSAKVNVEGMGTDDSVLFSSGSGQTLTCTFGSKTATLSTDTNLEAAVSAAGSVLVIGGDFYQVASVSGTTVTLEHPFAGTTGAFTSNATQAADTVGFLTAGEIDTLEGIGLQLTGVDVTDFDVDRNRLFGQSRFNVRFAKDGENVGATITTTQPNNGNGDYRQVLTDFYNSAGNLGQRWVSDTPAVTRTVPTDGSGHSAFTSASLGFGTIAVSVEKTNRTLLSSGTAKQLVRLYLAFDDNTNDGISGTAQTNLETIFGAAGVITDAS